MGDLIPHSEEKPVPVRQRSWLWVSLGAAFLLCLILFLQRQTVSHAREKAHREKGTPVSGSEEASPMVRFTRDDIGIENHWTLLAGRHPVVTFRCTLDAAAPTCKRAVLCYRSLGEETWSTVDTGVNRASTAKIMLRDLYRDMPYECFFVLICRDTMFQSEVVRFGT